nr:Chain B, HdmX Peptide [Homo sapiens]
LDLAHSSESQ